MAVTKQPVTDLIQYNGHNAKDFKLIISEELESKIRTFCALSPDREWSGVLFYTFEGTFDKGITIFANDMYLMDQGSGAHTEFDLDAPEITRHLVVEGLYTHCIGLIHSHNRMRAFFSGEDTGTLTTHGQHMNNFVSLVVNNEGQYVARLTRQVNFSGVERKIIEGTSVSPVFNTDTQETYEYKNENEVKFRKNFIEYVDLNISIPKVGTTNAAIERFGEINSRCSAQKVFTPLNATSTVFQKDPMQGSLFKDDEDDYIVITPKIERELAQIPWAALGFGSWISQVFGGSPFAPELKFSAGDVSTLNLSYKKRFPTEVEFAFWFDWWFDFMLSEVGFDIKETEEFSDGEEALLYKVYSFIEDRPFLYKDSMLKSVSNRMI